MDYDKEIRHAISARTQGNEGMARVCARRAAGIVIAEYLSRRGYKNINPSAFARLKLFNTLPDIDERVRIVASHFILKVSYNRNLPGNIDLINEAMWMKKTLLLDNTN